MTTRSPWLIISYTPGLVHHRLACQIEVDDHGRLTQTLLKGRRGKWEKRILQKATQLEVEQLESLRNAVARIDFARLDAQLLIAPDSGSISIEVCLPESGMLKVEGSIFKYDREWPDFQRTFEPAQRVWRLVYDMLPKKFLFPL